MGHVRDVIYGEKNTALKYTRQQLLLSQRGHQRKSGTVIYPHVFLENGV